MNKIFAVFLALLAVHTQVHAASVDAEVQPASWLFSTMRRLLHGDDSDSDDSTPAPVEDDRRRIFDTDCADSYRECATWAQQGHCQTNVQVHTYCKASCGQCPKTWSVTEGKTTVDRDATTTGTEVVTSNQVDQWGNAIPANGGANGATGGDGRLEGNFATSQGEKTTKAEQLTEFTENKKTNSEKIFGTSHGTPPGTLVAPVNDCADLHQSCRVWARQGYCQTSAQMNVYCKASCGQCGGNRNWSQMEGTTKTERDATTTGTETINSKQHDQWGTAGAGGIPQPVGADGLPQPVGAGGVNTSQGEKTTVAEQKTEFTENQKTNAVETFGSSHGTRPGTVAAPANDCADLHQNCRAWVQQGHCITWAQIVYCKASCGLCGGNRNWSQMEGTTKTERDQLTTGTETINSKQHDQWGTAGAGGVPQPVGAGGLPQPVGADGFHTTQGEKITQGDKTTEFTEKKNTQATTKFGNESGTRPGTFVQGVARFPTADVPMTGFPTAGLPMNGRPMVRVPVAGLNNWSQTTGTEEVNREEDITGTENVKTFTDQRWANVGGGAGLGGDPTKAAGVGAPVVGLPNNWFTEQGQRLTQAEKETIAREQRNMQKTTVFGGQTGGGRPLWGTAPAGGHQWSNTQGTEDVTRVVDITEKKNEQEWMKEQWAKANGGAAALGNGAGLAAPTPNGMWQTGQGERRTDTDRTTVLNEKRNTQKTTQFGGTTGTPPAGFAMMADGNPGVFGAQREQAEGDDEGEEMHLLGFGAWIAGPDGEAIWVEGEDAIDAIVG